MVNSSDPRYCFTVFASSSYMQSAAPAGGASIGRRALCALISYMALVAFAQPNPCHQQKSHSAATAAAMEPVAQENSSPRNPTRKLHGMRSRCCARALETGDENDASWLARYACMYWAADSEG